MAQKRTAGVRACYFLLLSVVVLVGIRVRVLDSPKKSDAQTLPTSQEAASVPERRFAVPKRDAKSDADFRSSLARVQRVTAKALPTSSERQQQKQILGNPEFVDSLVGSLLRDAASLLSREAEKDHMLRVDVFLSALNPAQNPVWEHAVLTAEAMLLDSEWRAHGPLRSRRLVAGDCIEIFQSLKRWHPARAEQILAKVDEKTRGLLKI